MKLTSQSSRQAKACLFVVASIALATMAASTAAADNLRVFDKRVSGVPSANRVELADNVYSPEFAPGLVVEGIDLLENPSGVITNYGKLSDGTNTEPDQNTYLILDHNPGGPTLTMIMDGISCSNGTRTAWILLTLPASISMWPVPTIASRF
jgi:hypothetical protein